MWLRGAAAAALAGVALAGCASGGGDSGSAAGGVVGESTTLAAGQITSILGATPAPTTAAAAAPAIMMPPKTTKDTLTIWLMPEIIHTGEVLDKVDAEFKKAYPHVDVTIEQQEWSTVQDKLTAALGTDATPDVAEIDNTDWSQFAAAGQFADLDSVTTVLDRKSWTPGLAASTALDGHTYTVPMYGTGRVLVYNKIAWARAGLTTASKTMADFEGDLAQLQQADSEEDLSAFWFPGKYWLGALPWVWGGGGQLAVQEGTTWTGAVDSTESQAGLTALQGIVDKYSMAPRDADEITAGGGQAQAFNNGKAGTALMLPWEIARLTPGTFGIFALPGNTAGQAAPQLLGGSNLAVSAKSTKQGLAVAWIRTFLSESIQKDYAKQTKNIPAIAPAAAVLKGDPLGDALEQISRTGRSTPVTPAWAEVERQEVLPHMLVTIFGPGQSSSSASGSPGSPSSPPTGSPAVSPSIPGSPSASPS